MPRKTTKNKLAPVESIQVSLLDNPINNPIPEPDYSVLADSLDATRYENEKIVVAIDIETSNIYPGYGPRDKVGLAYTAQFLCVSIAFEDQTLGKQRVTTFCAPHLGKELQNYFNVLFSNKEATIVAHNAVFDLRLIGRITVPVLCMVWDTMNMQRLITPDATARLDLVSVARANDLTVPDQHSGMKGKRETLDGMPWQVVAEYCESDTTLALTIFHCQYDKVLALAQSDTKIRDLCLWEMRSMREYSRMAQVGVCVNQDLLRSKKLELTELLQEFYLPTLTQHGLTNPDSNAEVVTLLYETLKIPMPAWSIDSPFFTDAANKRLSEGSEYNETSFNYKDLSATQDVFELHLVNPEVKLLPNPEEILQVLRFLIDYSIVSKQLATIDGLLDHSAQDNRIHSLITIGTATGRRSSGMPNIQNLRMFAPSETDPAGDCSGFLVASQENGPALLVGLDYSNAENWSQVLISADPNFAKACASSDFHSENASKYFGQRWLDVQSDPLARKEMRRKSKMITFGDAYGAGIAKLALMTGLTKAEIQEIKMNKDIAYPRLAAVRKEVVNKANNTGLVKLWTGRGIAIARGKGYTAWNYVNQGAVAELVKRAIVLISEELRDRGLLSRVALEVHDEIVLEVLHSESDIVLPLVQHIMQSVVPETLLNRTNPPIQFRADLDLAENSKKWGKYQPQLTQQLTQHLPDKLPVVEKIPETVQESPAKPVKIENTVLDSLNTETKQIRGNLSNSANLANPSEYVPNSNPTGSPVQPVALGNVLYWSDAIGIGFDYPIAENTASEWLACYNALVVHCDTILNKLSKCGLPKVTSDALSSWIDIEEFTLDAENAAKVPLAWRKVLKTQTDPQQIKLITMSLKDLQGSSNIAWLSVGDSNNSSDTSAIIEELTLWAGLAIDRINEFKVWRNYASERIAKLSEYLEKNKTKKWSI